jgi:ankyrin repeat protein
MLDSNTLNANTYPLHEAASEGRIEIVQTLIATGANVNATDENGLTPLHEAATEGHTEVIQILITAGANVNAADEDGLTPLHEVANTGHTEIIQTLINAGANVNTPSNDAFTSLHYAASNGHHTTVRMLISLGSDINATDNDGITALHLAAGNGHILTVQALITLNANVNAVVQYNRTPLHYAANSGHTEITQALINAGADKNAKDSTGLTPLHSAAGNGHTATIQSLIEQGANVNATSNDGLTPLHYAAGSGRSESVEALIALGANINAANNDGLTPLHCAAGRGHAATVQTLIALRADVHAVSTDGEASIVIAYENGHHDIVQLLQTHGAVVPDYLLDQAGSQNTHTASVHESISESALKLRERYGIDGLQAARDAASVWLKDATLDNLKNEFLRKLETAQKLLPELLESNDINLSSSTGALKALQLDFLRNDLPDFSNLGKSEAQDCLNTFIERRYNEQLEIQRTHFLPKLEAAKRCLPRILDSNFIDARSKISTPDAIGLAWLGLECPDIQSPNNDSINRLIILVNHLYEIQRGYNLNKDGEDNQGDDINICEAGTFNKLIDTLNGMHRDVSTLFVTPETIRFKAQALVNILCEKLPDDEKLKYAKLWMTGDKAPPKALCEFLKTDIPAELDSEFGSFKNNIADYNKVVSDFLDNLEYTEAPKSMVTCFQKYQGSSSSSAIPESEPGKRTRDENLDDSDSSDEEQTQGPERKRHRHQ